MTRRLFYKPFRGPSARSYGGNPDAMEQSREAAYDAISAKLKAGEEASWRHACQCLQIMEENLEAGIFPTLAQVEQLSFHIQEASRLRHANWT